MYRLAVSRVSHQLVRFVRKMYKRVVQMTVWQPYGQPFKTLASLLNHLCGGHFVVVFMHQTINPLLDSFLSFSLLTF
jgi:hypothetical protein